MIQVALTGGIGSGKTTVANIFRDLGVPIYIADDEAKHLMSHSKAIRKKLIVLFGEQAYLKKELNKPYLSKLIFNDHSLLQKMNAIVHPKVGKHYQKWLLKQQGPYVIKEAAIIFENETYKNYDYIITVTAPKRVRLERVINRDNTTKEKVESIIKNQWGDKEKIEQSQFVIENIDLHSTKTQVFAIHNKLIKLILDNKF